MTRYAKPDGSDVPLRSPDSVAAPMPTGKLPLQRKSTQSSSRRLLYYHPDHLTAVVASGKHVDLEKPVAVDVPGALHVIEIGKRAEGKLSFDVGFQIRDCPPFVELVRRIHAGALGKIAQAHPLKASATGGRLGRPDADGDAFGNYNALFHYPDGVDVTFSSTQFAKGWWDVTERFFGTKGTSQSPYTGPLGIWEDEPWQYAAAAKETTSEPKAFSVTGNFSLTRAPSPLYPASWYALQPTRAVKLLGKKR